MAKKSKKRAAGGKFFLGVLLAALSTAIAFLAASIFDKKSKNKTDGQAENVQQDVPEENYIILNDNEENHSEEVADVEAFVQEEVTAETAIDTMTDESADAEDKETQEESSDDDDITKCIK